MIFNLYLEEEPENSIIGFLRYYGINKNSNILNKSLKITFLKEKKIKAVLYGKTKIKDLKKSVNLNIENFSIRFINISDDYFDIYYSKLGQNNSVQIFFNNCKISRKQNIEMIKLSFFNPVTVIFNNKETVITGILMENFI